jgi:amidase
LDLKMKYTLTEKNQQKFVYTIGPYAEPVLRIKPGDSVTVETLDAFEGKIVNEQVKPSDVAHIPFVNPLNGPIWVDGAEIGDTLAVKIESIKPRGPQPRGVTCLQRYFGALSPTASGLCEPFPELVRKVEITEAGIIWSDRITFPYEPFVGTIGTSPHTYSYDSLTPDNHGGNMDLPDIAPGSTLYLPVRVEGAMLFLGDCHACQGDGELCGVAIEFPTFTQITVNLIKKWTLDWPRLENPDMIMSIGSARPMEEAARIAYNDLLTWMVKSYGFDKWDAYFILSQVGKVRVGNMVDPKFTVGASISKKYLPNPD